MSKGQRKRPKAPRGYQFHELGWKSNDGREINICRRNPLYDLMVAPVLKKRSRYLLDTNVLIDLDRHWITHNELNKFLDRNGIEIVITQLHLCEFANLATKGERKRRAAANAVEFLANSPHVRFLKPFNQLIAAEIEFTEGFGIFNQYLSADERVRTKEQLCTYPAGCAEYLAKATECFPNLRSVPFEIAGMLEGLLDGVKELWFDTMTPIEIFGREGIELVLESLPVLMQNRIRESAGGELIPPTVINGARVEASVLFLGLWLVGKSKSKAHKEFPYDKLIDLQFMRWSNYFDVFVSGEYSLLKLLTRLGFPIISIKSEHFFGDLWRDGIGDRNTDKGLNNILADRFVDYFYFDKNYPVQKENDEDRQIVEEMVEFVRRGQTEFLRKRGALGPDEEVS